MLLACIVGLALTVASLSGSASAAEDPGLCDENHDRVSIPAGFPLAACFDGKTLYVRNGTQFPLVLTVSGEGAGRPERYMQGIVSGASGLMSFIRPADFGLMPPGYYLKVGIGSGEAKVHLGTADAGLQKMYVVSELVWRFMPAEVPQEVLKSAAELVRELSDVGDQYVTCRNRNNAWGDVGCSALLGRNVSFAVGRAAVNGLGGGVVKAVVSLFDTASWADAASGDLIDLKDGQRDFTIAAYTPPEEPPPPAPPVDNDSSSGGSADNGGDNNNPPPRQDPPPQIATATVQNKHLEGRDGLVEDLTTSYLSTAMQPRCASSGCKITGTDMRSGDTFTAVCWDVGAMMTNQNRDILDDDNNSHRVDSDHWLKGTKNDQTGYISFVYVTPDSRSLAIPRC